MKNANKLLIAAGLLVVPATGTAQVANHVSFGFGLAAGFQTSYWDHPGFGLAYQPVGAGFSQGLGFGYSSNHDDYWGGYDDGYWPFSRCSDYLWYDPFFGCHGFYGHSPFGWSSWHSPWWRPFGFLGWPSHRYVRQHWYAYSPYWGGYPGWGGWGWDYYPSLGYDSYYGGRYRNRHGYSRDRIVRRSPFFGPRYKESPRVYVTDNGPERPTSRLGRPRGSGVIADDASNRGIDRRAWPRARGGDTRTAKPRTTPDARTARPTAKPREIPSTTSRPGGTRPIFRGAPSRIRKPTPARTAPPKVRKRPVAAPRTGSVTPRRPLPTTRSAPTRRPQPTTRSAPTRRTKPVTRSAPPKRSPPKARPAPSRRPPPKARPAPRRSGGSKAPPKRSGPVRRRGG